MREENSLKAVQCLNEMITNTLTHALDCLEFMSKLQSPSGIRFYAIPQVRNNFSTNIKSQI